MTMLVLVDGEGTVISNVPAGGWFDLPNGDRVSPAYEGWTDGEYSLVPYQEEEPPPPTPEEIREQMPPLNPAQIRLGLLSIGITEEMIDEALQGNPEGIIEWKYRPTYKRTHPIVVSLAESFELTPEQVDSLWMWAAGL